MRNTEAIWNISLDCTCPECGEDFNILDEENFWEREIHVVEHDTYRSRDMGVMCPNCEHEFAVDLAY